MLGDGAHLLIDLIEQRRDKLDGGGHRLLRTWQGCTLSTSLEEVHDYGNRVIMAYHLLLVCKRLTPLVHIAPDIAVALMARGLAGVVDTLGLGELPQKSMPQHVG